MPTLRSLLLTTVLSSALVSVAFAGKPNRDEPPSEPEPAADVQCTGCVDGEDIPDESVAFSKLRGQLQQRIADLEAGNQAMREELDNLSYQKNKRWIIKDRDGVVVGVPET